jgi:hypothetical protein
MFIGECIGVNIENPGELYSQTAVEHLVSRY